VGVKTARFVLLTREEAISDAVGAAAAAHGVEVEVLASADAALSSWSSADVVLVGGDQAAALASHGPKERTGVYLVGGDPAQLGRWSVPLAGRVIVLPEGLAALSAVLAEDRGLGAPVVAVVGGSGGIGASTVAAGLAVSARRRGLTAALVDLDPVGGGVDLLLGAERTPGWRWPDLLGARGEVTDVRRFLPQVDGLTVVSMGRPVRGGPASEVPSGESIKAVLGALGRHHDLVVADVGRVPIAGARPVVGRCRMSLVVTGTGVRSVAATASVLGAVELAAPALVVRQQGGSRVPADVIGRALGLAVAGVLREDKALRRGGEVGEPPGRAGRGRWQRAIGRLLDGLAVKS